MALLPGQAAALATNAEEEMEMALIDVESGGAGAVDGAEPGPGGSVPPPPLEVVADAKPTLDAYMPKAVARESSLESFLGKGRAKGLWEKAKKGTVKKKHAFKENTWDVFLSYRVAADQALVSAAPKAK